MKSTTTIRLPDGLLGLARKKARESGTTLTALIEQGLRAVVSDPGKTPRPRRVKLPVSSATGGFALGIDPVKLQTLAQEIDDVDRMTRGK
jgi:hypothetical protein